MKLLLDENLSRRTVPFLQTEFSDFQERSLITGHPPQVVWLKIPNRPKTAVLNILLGHRTEIERALLHENRACVEISLRSSRRLDCG